MLNIKMSKLSRNTVMFLLLILSSTLFSQHRGDLLSFQGFDLSSGYGAKSLAMGGAFTAQNGELEALFWNPAGLNGIEKFNFSVNTFQYKKVWRERQDYRPNRQLVTMSFILDGLYMPNPDYDGWYDYEAFLDDSTYHVDDPALGEDPYSEEGADWQKEAESFEMYHISAAIPFEVMGKKLVLAAGYVGNVPVMNYDRNQTHLSPHPAFDGYGDLPPRVTSADDSLRIKWSDYERERIGPLQQIVGGVSFSVTDNINLGVAVNHISGDIDESMSLNSIGHFDLVEGYNVFRFGYDTLNVSTTGQSSFSALRFDLGAQFQFNRFSLGVRITPAYTINREYEQLVKTISVDTTASMTLSGKDEMKIPFGFSAGIAFNPVSNVRLAFDLEKESFSENEFTFSTPDTTHRQWVDQLSYRAGIEYAPVKRIAIRAGYQNVPQVFIPDGVGIDDRGPESEIYSLGIGIKALMGSFDVTYQRQVLKYYDVYYSNTNWAYEELTTWLFGYTIKF